MAMYVAIGHDKLFQTSLQWSAVKLLSIHERGPMKLKHLAALMMLLLALGCTQQPAATPAADAGSESSADSDVTASTTVEPETETETLVASAATTVKFDVTGMK